MDLESTIVAVSSATGAGARMIVRMTGPKAVELTRTICQPPDSAAVVRRELRFDGLRAGAWVYRFMAPRSYTGQDLFEFHIPGNPILAGALVRSLVTAGASVAGPGEFTARALFTGKLDLSQAEGVAAVVSAQNRRQLLAARRLAAGELSRRLAPMTEALAEAVTLVEAGIDFVDEGIEAISQTDARHRLTRLQNELRELLDSSERFERMGGVPSIVLVGRPNAGKSTLLNALCGRPRAVVSSTAGTTRDVLSADVLLRSGTARLLDMAGIDDDAPDAVGGAEDDPAMRRIEHRMQELAQQAAATADVVVMVRDATDGREPLTLNRPADVIVWTKSDLANANALSPSPCTPGEGGDEGSCDSARPQNATPTLTLPQSTGRGEKGVAGRGGAVDVSALTGMGMDGLRDRLDRATFGESKTSAGGSTMALNARHRLAIEAAGTAIKRALERVDTNESEWVAAELRVALDELGSITGVVSPDDILGRIFSTFCIGK